jgi:hypothetical protein
MLQVSNAQMSMIHFNLDTNNLLICLRVGNVT